MAEEDRTDCPCGRFPIRSSPRPADGSVRREDGPAIARVRTIGNTERPMIRKRPGSTGESAGTRAGSYRLDCIHIELGRVIVMLNHVRHRGLECADAGCGSAVRAEVIEGDLRPLEGVS